MSLNLILLGLFSFLTLPKMQETSPAYYIAYNVLIDSKASNYDVFAVDLDGSNKRNITHHNDLAWTYFAWKEKLFFCDVCRPDILPRRQGHRLSVPQEQTRPAGESGALDHGS
ncbi:MAG TPA: hypothetical protein DEP53_19380 [Bacteroidetes bacterium]|nr:hypothetical protein [Bacteroidota bacterium]